MTDFTAPDLTGSPVDDLPTDPGANFQGDKLTAQEVPEFVVKVRQERVDAIAAKLKELAQNERDNRILVQKALQTLLTLKDVGINIVKTLA